MGKRGSTDHSLVVGIDKPAGLTSHDVVNAVRRIYGERRVGHAGTLDPAATGVLVVCVGPAARLDRFLVGHDKTYEFTCVFGTQTDTDDAEGVAVATAPVPDNVFDRDFAERTLGCMLGPSQQLPPAYSSIKVGGKTAHREARAGHPLELAPRDIVIHELSLLDMAHADAEGDAAFWRIRARVSSGTYIRSLARDLGAVAGTCAHVGSLRRIRSGSLDVDECVSVETLERDPFRYLVDPVKLLGVRILFADGALSSKVASGAPVPAGSVELYSYGARGSGSGVYCACTSGIERDLAPLAHGEVVGVVCENRLVALYEYDSGSGMLRSSCGFSIGVKRGGDC